ncbi:MAG: hypothetical protein ACI38Q_01185 [Candidatus Bruticola sp.]
MNCLLSRPDLSRYLALFYGLPYSDEELDKAQAESARWLHLVGQDPLEVLSEKGFKIEYLSLSVPGVLVWGRTEIRQRRVYIDSEALKVLVERCRNGLPWTVDFSLLLRLTAAHELFHILSFTASLPHTELAAVVFSLYFCRR